MTRRITDERRAVYKAMLFTIVEYNKDERLTEKTLRFIGDLLADSDDDRKRIAELEAEVAGLREPKWQPIETAPRDGTVIDVWMQSYFWDADGQRQLAVEMRIPNAIWFDQMWTNVDGNPHEDLDGFTYVEFTHWMPLPPPPASARDQTLKEQGE